MTQIAVFRGSGSNNIDALLSNKPDVIQDRGTPWIRLGLITAAAAFCIPLSISAATPAAGGRLCVSSRERL